MNSIMPLNLVQHKDSARFACSQVYCTVKCFKWSGAFYNNMLDLGLESHWHTLRNLIIRAL